MLINGYRIWLSNYKIYVFTTSKLWIQTAKFKLNKCKSIKRKKNCKRYSTIKSKFLCRWQLRQPFKVTIIDYWFIGILCILCKIRITILFGLVIIFGYQYRNFKFYSKKFSVNEYLFPRRSKRIKLLTRMIEFQTLFTVNDLLQWKFF